MSEKNAKVLLGLGAWKENCGKHKSGIAGARRSSAGTDRITNQNQQLWWSRTAHQPPILRTPSPSFFGLSEADVFCGLADERPPASIFLNAFPSSVMSKQRLFIFRRLSLLRTP